MTKRKPYVIKEREATLVLDESTSFAGAEIDVSLSVAWATHGEVQHWLTGIEELSDDPDIDDLDALLRSGAALFAPYLRGWNIADRNGPVPATAEGLLSIRNSDFLATVIGAWIDATKTDVEPTD